MDLVSEVRDGLRQRMDEVGWLDDRTRDLSIEKVRKKSLHVCRQIIQT